MYRRPTVPWALAALLCALLACSSDPGGGGDDDDTTAEATPEVSRVFDHDYGPAALSIIGDAQDTLYVIEYVIYDDGVVADLLDAMEEAHARGVEVRVLADEESASTAAAIDTLVAAGVDAKLDSAGTTTHNKLILADDQVLVGSHNFSDNAMTENHEASLLIEDATVAEYYERYFQSLWQDSSDDPGLDPIDVGGVVPIHNDEIAHRVIDCLRDATTRVRIVLYAMVYNADYSDSDINRAVEEVVAAHERGLDVEVILCGSTWIADNAINDAAIEILVEAGVPVRTTPSHVVTHAKALLCDDTVLVGDANWSYSAFSLYNGTSAQVTSAALAQDYLTWFEILTAESAPVE